MITPKLSTCTSCPGILSLIKDIDCKIMKISNNLYNNAIFMLNRPIPSEDLIDLLNYKRILTYKYCNSLYAKNYSLTSIASKVKKLTLGETCINCDELYVKTVTRTTTQRGPVPTTTTSTTAPTTTTTTTAIPVTTTSTTTDPGETTTTSTTPIPTTTTTTTAIGSVKCGTSTSYPGGQSYPTTKIVNVGSDTGTVTFYFSAASIPDKFEVWFDGVKVIDTGYRGSVYYQEALDNALLLLGAPLQTILVPAYGTLSFVKSTATPTVEVRVYAPLTGTAWNFTVNCPT